MSRNLFFTGISGAGKSTVINRALQAVGLCPMGFRTIRVYDANDNICAYLVSDLRSPERGVRFMVRENGEQWRRDYPLLCRAALEALEGVTNGDVVLLDEIGGKELLDDTFYRRLTELLKSPARCIGVLKDRSGVESLLRHSASDNATYRETYERFRLILETCPNTSLLTVTEDNREAMLLRAVSFLQSSSCCLQC